MAYLAKSFQNFMPSVPLYNHYQNIPDHSQPLYQQSPPIPQYQHATAYDPKAPIYDVNQKQYSRSVSKARRLFAKFRRYLKIIVFISNICSAFLTLYMLLAMAGMTALYLTTKNETGQDEVKGMLKPWPPDPKTWPTYLLLASSGLTFVGAIFSLVRNCLSSRSKIAFRLIYYLIHIALWVAVTIFYRLGRTGDDLWGWSCDMVGGTREKLFKDILNYDAMCRIQVRYWNKLWVVR